MATVKEIYAAMNRWAPFSTQMSFDNAGFLVGRGETQVTRVLVALDITMDVVREAEEQKAQLIVSHHPVIFHPLRALTDESTTGEILLRMAEHSIAGICAHTNLDAAQGGVNCVLAQTLCLEDIGQLHPDGTDEQGRVYGIGRIGTAHQRNMSAREYASFVKERLNTASVRFVDAGKPVNKVAVGGGSCGSMLEDALNMGCDTFVTADVKHDQYLQADMCGINLMDAGHFATENVICPEISHFLQQEFPDLTIAVATSNREAYQSI